jgi:tRNA-binding protein
MKDITWNKFEMVELRSGTIIDVKDFQEARNPAYKIVVDF